MSSDMFRQVNDTAMRLFNDTLVEDQENMAKLVIQRMEEAYPPVIEPSTATAAALSGTPHQPQNGEGRGKGEVNPTQLNTNNTPGHPCQVHPHHPQTGEERGKGEVNPTQLNGGGQPNESEGGCYQQHTGTNMFAVAFAPSSGLISLGTQTSIFPDQVEKLPLYYFWKRNGRKPEARPSMSLIIWNQSVRRSLNSISL